MRRRAYAYTLSVVLAALVASPLFGWFANDDFPVSNYPMFAGRRPSLVSVATVQLVTADGSTEPAPPSLVANDEVIQAYETVRQAIRQGPPAITALCEHVAGGLPPGRAARVRIQTADYDAVAYFDGDREPRGVHVHGECEALE